MDNFFGADPELVRQALKAQGSDYVLPPLEPSLSQLPDIGPAPADVGPLTAPQPVIDPYTAPEGFDPRALEAPVLEAPPSTPGSLWEGANAAMGQLDTSAEQQAQAAVLQGAAREQGFAQQADIHADEIREAETLLAQHRDRSKALEATHTAALERFRTAQAEAAAMPPPKDRRSSSQRTMSALALGMGSIADHFAMVGGGQTNNADQIQKAIDNKIERDLNAQREAIAHKQGAAQGALNELSIAQKHFGLTVEADQYATALIKEKTAAELGQIAANTSNREVKAQVLEQSAKYRAAAAAEKLDLYKTMMKKKMSAFDVVMMKQAGMTDAQIREYDVQTGSGVVEGPPSLKDNPNLSKSDASKVNVDAARSHVPGLETLGDPALTSGDDTKKSQEMYAGFQRIQETMRNMKDAYTVVSSKSKPEAERLRAAARYKSLSANLPGYVSQATGSGTPQEGEAQRILGSLPTLPPINDVAGARGALAAVDNWFADRSTDPAMFDDVVGLLRSTTSSAMEPYRHKINPGWNPPAPEGSDNGTRGKGGGTSKPSEVRTWKPGLPVPGKK